jgi:acylphosphatase
MNKRLVLKIYGRVQGVFFRHESQEKAREFGLVGFVRNEPDGVVLVTAEGGDAHLKALVRWCERGPKFSSVTKTEELWQEATGEFTDFTIKH